VDERDPNAPPVEPIYDTWGLTKYAGSWMIAPVRLDAEGTEWIAAALAATLEAYGPLARPWAAGIVPLPAPDAAPRSLAWQPGESQSAYRDALLAAIADVGAPVQSLELRIDLLAHARTGDSPHAPVRSWLRLPTEIELRSPGADDTSYANLTFDHTLFRPESADGIDNRELYALNAPLLESALRGWEERLGPITEVDGLTGVFHYGYRSEGDE
jgi:hypothetical protein